MMDKEYTKEQIEKLLEGIYLCHRDNTGRYHEIINTLILELFEKAGDRKTLIEAYKRVLKSFA